MKSILLALLLSGCSTTVYRNGQPVFRTNANVKDLVIDGDRVTASSIDHSSTIRASGAVVREVGAAATAVGSATILR